MTTTKRSIRETSQEEQWFQRIELQRRRKQEEKQLRAGLAAGLGIEDAALLDALTAIGIDRDKLPAIEWVPLVLVAWADGAVQAGERDAILRAAESTGLAPGSPPLELLREWLESESRGDLLGAWKAYLAAVSRREDAGAQRAREAWVRSRAREVAEAAGGWLGFAKVSSGEGSVMLEVARAFRTAQRR